MTTQIHILFIYFKLTPTIAHTTEKCTMECLAGCSGQISATFFRRRLFNFAFFHLCLTEKRRKSSHKPLVLSEACKQLLIYRLPQVLRLHLKRFRQVFSPLLPTRRITSSVNLSVAAPVVITMALIGTLQMVGAKPSGENWRPRGLRPSSEHQTILLHRLRSLCPQRRLHLRSVRRRYASRERLRLRALHGILLQHRRR